MKLLKDNRMDKMDIDEDDFKSLIDHSNIDSEEDITDFEDFENFYNLGGDDLDSDGEIKELEF